MANFIAPGQGGYNGPRMASAPIVQASADAFGAAGARQAGQLANMGMKAGLNILAAAQEEQKRRDQAYVRDAMNQARMDVMVGEEEIFSKTGKGGVNAVSDMRTLLDSARSRYSGNCIVGKGGGNIERQQMFDDAWSAMSAEKMRGALRHQLQQQRAFSAQTLQVQIDAMRKENVNILLGRDINTGTANNGVPVPVPGSASYPVGGEHMIPGGEFIDPKEIEMVEAEVLDHPHPGTQIAKRILRIWENEKEIARMLHPNAPPEYQEMMAERGEVAAYIEMLDVAAVASPEKGLELLKEPRVEEILPPLAWHKYKVDLTEKALANARKRMQDSLDADTDLALANGAGAIDVALMQAATYGKAARDSLETTIKDAGISKAEAAEFADGQYLTDEMELSGSDIIRQAYQDRSILSPAEAEDLKLRLVAEAGWSPEIAGRVVAMPRMKMMAKNANEARDKLTAYADIRKAIAEADGNIQGTELWAGLSQERRTLALAMQEQMARRVDIDDLTQIHLYGVLKSRRNADAGGFYQWMNNEARMMQVAAVFHNKPELLLSLMSGQPISPEKIPSAAALSLEAGELMANESALGKEMLGRVGNSVDAFMMVAQKPERDAMKAQISSAIVGDLMNAARMHKTTIDGLAPLERDRIINDGLLRYSKPGAVYGYNPPVYGDRLTPSERVDSRLDPSSLPAAERLNLTAPGGIVAYEPSMLPDDAGAMVRVETGIDLLRTPEQAQARIRNAYGLRNDLSISQQLDTGVFIVVPPAGKGMIVARDGSVIDEIPEARTKAMNSPVELPGDVRDLIEERAAASVYGWRTDSPGYDADGPRTADDAGIVVSASASGIPKNLEE